MPHDLRLRTPCRIDRFLSGALLVSGIILLSSVPARATCTFAPPAGDDTYVCDSGTSTAGLTDLGGNNTLRLPTGGTGTIDGNVLFGAGTDTVEIRSGTIAGTVDQGDGADVFSIADGTVTDNVQQGSGIDDFRMTGGVIQSLNQGDNHDTFFMSGGRIINAFDDGDTATMTGGRIGRVNMKLDDNTFDMSGGTIDKNLVAGFGNDTITLSDGTIGGNISVSGGTDSVTVTGGTVGGEVRMSAGDDTFTWDGGGIIYGTIDLGGDDDTTSLRNLTDANMGDVPRLSGGSGNDTLAFDNVKTGDVARFDGWESINLANDSQLVFNDTLTLGDSGSGTGTLTVDAASTLYGGVANGGIASFAAERLAHVVNAGRIDLTNGGDSTTDTFTIHGDYTGDGGQLFLNTVLGDDDSPSDKLVIDGGAASGTTGMNIVQTGGTGAATPRDGILVVEATHGGTTASGAFALNDRVVAGAYEYFLFRSGSSADTTENWYLRSTIVTPPASPAPQPAGAPGDGEGQNVPPEPPETTPPPPPSEFPAVPLPTDGSPTTDPVDDEPPIEADDPAPKTPPAPASAEPADPPPPAPDPSTQPAPVPDAGGITLPPTPGATPVVADVVPLYRIEVPAYAVVPAAAHYLAAATLGTFHERRGEQSQLHSSGAMPTTWGRIFGQDTETKWDGTVEPSFDGKLFGFQAGQDVLGRESDSGHIDRLGLFLGYSRMNGDVRGQTLGWNDVAVGDMHLDGTSLGLYWTHIGPGGGYLDGVLMGTRLDGEAHAASGQGIDIDGSALTASLEGGYPFAVTDRWTLEPQGQLIWGRLSLDDRADDFSSVSFDGRHALTGRIGVRLQARYESDTGILQPYVKANLRRRFSSDQTIRFGGDPIVTGLDGTSLELGGGLIAHLTGRLSLFATADYTANLGGKRTRILEGNVGLNMNW